VPNFHTKLTEDQERELVRRVLANEAGAGDEFVLRYRERIYAVCVALLGWQDPEAEDAVQETFGAAWLGLPGFEFRSSLYTWLNQICVRQCYRRIRARSSMALGAENDLAAILGQTASDEGGALRELDEERSRWLKKAVQALGEACRKLVTMRDFEGLSYAALARTLKAPIGTVMSRLARCREKLKAQARAWQDGVDGG
jgi:RNA polymerase sigma-70 factor (ECF subfamily)